VFDSKVELDAGTAEVSLDTFSEELVVSFFTWVYANSGTTGPLAPAGTPFVLTGNLSQSFTDDTTFFGLYEVESVELEPELSEVDSTISLFLSYETVLVTFVMFEAGSTDIFVVTFCPPSLMTVVVLESEGVDFTVLVLVVVWVPFELETYSVPFLSTVVFVPLESVVTLVPLDSKVVTVPSVALTVVVVPAVALTLVEALTLADVDALDSKVELEAGTAEVSFDAVAVWFLTEARLDILSSIFSKSKDCSLYKSNYLEVFLSRIWT
jgi:hypothetical protein